MVEVKSCWGRVYDTMRERRRKHDWGMKRKGKGKYKNAVDGIYQNSKGTIDRGWVIIHYHRIELGSLLAFDKNSPTEQQKIRGTNTKRRLLIFGESDLW
jgi:hypothetical protein